MTMSGDSGLLRLLHVGPRNVRSLFAERHAELVEVGPGRAPRQNVEHALEQRSTPAIEEIRVVKVDVNERGQVRARAPGHAAWKEGADEGSARVAEAVRRRKREQCSA